MQILYLKGRANNMEIPQRVRVLPVTDARPSSRQDERGWSNLGIQRVTELLNL